MSATKTQVLSPFKLVDNINVNVEHGWVLTGPPYSHYFTPRPRMLQRQGSVKGEPRVLKKRRSFNETPRLRSPKTQLLPRPTTYVEPAQTMYTFPSNPSTSHSGVQFSGLRTESLWLNRSTRPIRKRRTPRPLQITPCLNPGSPSPSPSPSPYVVSNSPKLPIGGKKFSKRTTQRAVKYVASPRAERGGTSPALLPAPHIPSLQLETLITSVESDFKRDRRLSKPLSMATSISMYSQASAPYGLSSEIRGNGENTGTAMEENEDAPYNFSRQSSETARWPISHRLGVDDVIYVDADSRLSISTSAHTATSTLKTLVNASPRRPKRHLEGTRLSLQPCFNLASADHILNPTNLPPKHAVPSPIDENTCRRREYEPKVEPVHFGEDICVDYDYIHATDILIHGTHPLLNLPVVRRPSHPCRPRRKLVPIRRRSDNRTKPAGKTPPDAPPPVSTNHKLPWKNGFKPFAKISSKVKTRNETCEGRRSIFSQVMQFFVKSSRS